MKKIKYYIGIVLTICLSFYIITSSVKVFAESELTEVDGATFKVTSNVVTKTLDGNIEYINDLGISVADRVDNSDATSKKEGTQVLNVLNVPSTTDLKVVTWRSTQKNAWKLSSVVNLAKDYEANNPGWMVIAGVNCDFFDIRGEGALPYQTSGVLYADGEMYRSHATTSIGLKNDGSTTPMVAGEKFETTSHQLQIYNENDQIIATYDITNFNEAPSPNGISAYFTYNVFDGDGKRVKVYATIPENNSYIISSGTILASNASEVYGKGNITSVNQMVECKRSEFGIVTENEEIKSKLSIGTKIRIQKNITGAYSDCDNIFGGGFHLIEDGKATTVSDYYRHPRTCIGTKEDGTIVLFTVDGRQPTDNMYGMNYNELQATLLHYGCTEAYNLDGGGSTTMIIKNNQGEFDVMNSPSDGSERNDANAILVVAPRLTLNVSQVTDTSMIASYPEPAQGVSINNIKLYINNEVLAINDNSYTYNNLVKNTEYNYHVEYDVTYRDHTSSIVSPERSLKTGKEKPKVDDCTYLLSDTNCTFNFSIKDPDNIISFIMLKCGKNIFFIDDLTSTSYIIEMAYYVENECVLIVEYNVDSSTKQSNSDNYTFIEYVEPDPEPDPDPDPEPDPDPNPNPDPDPVVEPDPEVKGCKKKNIYIYITSIISFTVLLFIFKKH